MEENQEPKRKTINIDDQSSIREYFGWGDLSLKDEIEQEKELEKQKRKEIRQELLGKVTRPAQKHLSKLKHSRPKKPKALIGTTVVLLTIFIALTFVVFGSSDPRKKIQEQQGLIPTEEFVKQSRRKLYYPSALPKGYKIDVQQGTNNETLAAYILTDGSESITLSQQENIPSEAFADLFEGAEELKTDKGTAFIRSLPSGATVAGIQLGESTIFLNSPDNPDPIKYSLLINGLKTY